MPTGRSSTSASGSTSSPYWRDRSATSRRVRRRSSRPTRSACSMPSVTFSATVKTGTSMKCWCTMPMPAAIASRGEPNFAGLPSIRISPSSGWVSPYRTFISVVFPAPFSPSRAWTWPGATDRLIPSFAASRPYLLVMPLSSSSTCVRPRLDRALGRRLDASVLDAGLDRLQFGLQRGGNHAGEVVERREHRATVLQRADVGATLEGAGLRLRHHVLHRGRDALGHAGDEVLAVLRRADTAVDVHPLHVDLAAGRVGLLYRLGRAEADVAGHREDDVRALADEGLGHRLALGLVGEVTGELALLGLLIPAEHLDVRLVLLVVVLDAVPVAEIG